MQLPFFANIAPPQVCNIHDQPIENYHSHVQGQKHQKNIKQGWMLVNHLKGNQVAQEEYMRAADRGMDIDRGCSFFIHHPLLPSSVAGVVCCVCVVAAGRVDIWVRLFKKKSPSLCTKCRSKKSLFLKSFFC